MKGYYLKYVFIVLLSGYHLMELDMIKIAISGFLEDFSRHIGGEKLSTMMEFKTLYSAQMLLGIPATMIWGYLSDRFGNFKTSVVHLAAHILITFLMAFSKDYNTYFYFSLLLSFFSNYVISLGTFTGWIPEKNRPSYNARSQFFTTMMLMMAPGFSSFINRYFKDSLVYHYHLILASMLTVFLVGFIYAFKDYKEDSNKVASKKEQEESEELRGLKGYLTIFKNKTAISLIFLGIYLRLAKKLVDVAFHLWAEMPKEKNGLGYDKTQLGNYSSFGGILSVFTYLYFADEHLPNMPKQMNLSFLVLGLVNFAFPLLSLTSGWVLDGALVILILFFNFIFSVLFSCWIGLLNEGVRKEIRSKSFALTLTIRSIIGTYLSNKAFDLLHWSLQDPWVTQHLGGNLNSACFFWIFTLISIGMYIYFRNLKLEKKEKKYELIF